MGLRDDKKRQTRERIASVAMEAFLARGYPAVTLSEIARAAGVSPATVFNYFPSKEAIVFDRVPAIEQELVNAIASRPRGTSTLRALRNLFAAVPSMRKPLPKDAARFRRFVQANPELAEYERQLFRRYEAAAAAAIAREAKVPRAEAEAITALAFDGFSRARASARPRETLDRLFDLLERGFSK